MGRKQRRQDNRIVEPPPTVTAKPRVRDFIAAPCSICQALRDQDEEAEGRSYSRVYGTVGKVRYCRCDFCGNTWKQTPES